MPGNKYIGLRYRAKALARKQSQINDQEPKTRQMKGKHSSWKRILEWQKQLERGDILCPIHGERYTRKVNRSTGHKFYSHYDNETRSWCDAKLPPQDR